MKAGLGHAASERPMASKGRCQGRECRVQGRDRARSDRSNSTRRRPVPLFAVLTPDVYPHKPVNGLYQKPQRQSSSVKGIKFL